jgi:hypothetical protein
MAYALFEDGEKLSGSFPTKEEALKKADQAGLVEENKDHPILQKQMEIRPCAPDPKPSNNEDLDWAPDEAT